MSKFRRILMFIQGNNPGMMANALILGADTVVFDLEDAASDDDKDAARILVRNKLKYTDFGEIGVGVRVNGVTTPYWEEDLEEIVPQQPSFLQIPKVERSEDLALVDRKLDEIEEKHGLAKGCTKIAPIIETAFGMENAFAIAKGSPRIDFLNFGAGDFVRDIGAVRSNEGTEYLFARQRLVVAAKAAGLKVYDTAFVLVDDDEELVRDCQFSRRLGYSGRAIITPRQVALAAKQYMPSEAEIEFAQEVMAAYEEAQAAGRGAITLRGELIDKANVDMARDILALSEEE